MKKFKYQKGFTLIELLVVVAIIGILAAVGVVAYNGYTKASKRAAAEANFDMVFKYAMHETTKCTMLELEIAFNDFFGCNSFNQTNSNSFKVQLVAHSTCVALGGLTYRGRSITKGTIKNPYVSNKPACGKDSNFKGRFDRQGGKYIARSDSYIETGSLYVTSNSDSSMFGFGKCPSYGKDNMLGMVVFMTGDHNCSVVRQIDTQSQFNAISLASCVASPCSDPNNIVVRDFSFD